ncbi:MAG: squalene/phytoene synthase family protein [Leptolyngbya sp. SIOISBB]|nr:squalene/phytoene synthase family protein [Leptolyngbya sp. SIOISBB]
MNISKAIASSVGNGIADDALKDADNGIWLQTLPIATQSAWQRRFYCIRWVDRLAEQDLIVQPGGKQFPAFYQAWKRLRRQGKLTADSQHWQVLQVLAADWFQASPALHQAEIAAWDEYLAAIADYHRSPLIIDRLEDYEVMLDRLAGSCFQLLPDLPAHQRAIARQFGWVDQFYNNLRDLYEDAQQGVCYFPTEILTEFGLTRQAILDFSCLHHPGYQPLMRFWVEDYLPRLRHHHLALTQTEDLQPAWQQLTTWFSHRYRRIERVMRECEYDFVVFAQQYWPAVERDLSAQRS